MWKAKLHNINIKKFWCSWISILFKDIQDNANQFLEASNRWLARLKKHKYYFDNKVANVSWSDCFSCRVFLSTNYLSPHINHTFYHFIYLSYVINFSLWFNMTIDKNLFTVARVSILAPFIWKSCKFLLDFHKSKSKNRKFFTKSLKKCSRKSPVWK